MTSCAQGDCGDDTLLPSEVAVSLGWYIIGGELYCPVHADGAAYRERQSVKEAAWRSQVRELAAHKQLRECERTGMSVGEWAAWHQWQADLVNFRRRNDRLPPEKFRMLSQAEWLVSYREGTAPGREALDVEAELNDRPGWLR